MSSYSHPVLRQLAAQRSPSWAGELPTPFTLPPYPPRSPAQLAEFFAHRLTELRGEVHAALDVDDAVPVLARLIQQHGLTRVACADVPWLTSLVHRAGIDPLTHDVRHIDGAVTTAHLLIADTGTVVVAAGPTAHRALTALPGVHIVVAHREQVVASLGDALRRIIEVAGSDGLPSDILFITGPSRTADIEKILVIPAHGPAVLHVVIIESS